ncbi:hypothetical protein [Streptomyces flavofungini]|uniref:hypothetical protein n=1 Tax=Streptomyces flavofungini TaxID=68200 RepID=UPI0034DF6863
MATKGVDVPETAIGVAGLAGLLVVRLLYRWISSRTQVQLARLRQQAPVIGFVRCHPEACSSNGVQTKRYASRSDRTPGRLMAESETFPVAAQRFQRSAALPAEQIDLVSLPLAGPPAVTAHSTGSPGTVARVDFARYYEQHLTRLIRHLMRQGAGTHEAAEAAQGAFTEAFPQWNDIVYPAAWLRKVAFCLYLRHPHQPGRAHQRTT